MKRKRILFLFIFTGLVIVNYPFVSQWVNKSSQSHVISGYQDDIMQMDVTAQAEMIEKAQVYNEVLAKHQSGVGDAFSTDISDKDYENILNPYDDGVMGYIEIPEIDVMLPIYHGTSVEVLEKGVGHLYGSSFPVGGESTHAVLSSHRGLPNQTLFTDLDQMEKGDYFYITVGLDTIAYVVDDIRTVTPDDTESLEIVQGMDYVTLVTCTPYGINSHRLLVRGERAPYIQEDTEKVYEVSSSHGLWYWQKIFFIVSFVIIIVSGILLLFPHNRCKNRKDGKK